MMINIIIIVINNIVFLLLFSPGCRADREGGWQGFGRSIGEACISVNLHVQKQ